MITSIDKLFFPYLGRNVEFLKPSRFLYLLLHNAYLVFNNKKLKKICVVRTMNFNRRFVNLKKSHFIQLFSVT